MLLFLFYVYVCGMFLCLCACMNMYVVTWGLEVHLGIGLTPSNELTDMGIGVLSVMIHRSTHIFSSWANSLTPCLANLHKLIYNFYKVFLWSVCFYFSVWPRLSSLTAGNFIFFPFLIISPFNVFPLILLYNCGS